MLRPGRWSGRRGSGSARAAGVRHLARVARQRQRDARRLQPEPRRDVRRAQRLRRAAEDDRGVEAVRNQIGVGVAEPAVDRIGVRQIECLRWNRRWRAAEEPAAGVAGRASTGAAGGAPCAAAAASAPAASVLGAASALAVGAASTAAVGWCCRLPAPAPPPPRPPRPPSIGGVSVR